MNDLAVLSNIPPLLGVPVLCAFKACWLDCVFSSTVHPNSGLDRVPRQIGDQRWRGGHALCRRQRRSRGLHRVMQIVTTGPVTVPLKWTCGWYNRRQLAPAHVNDDGLSLTLSPVAATLAPPHLGCSGRFST